MRAITFISIFILHFMVYRGNAQNPVITPAWAFKHIVWEDSLNTEAGVIKLVDSYLSKNIPVEATIIDSPWSTAYNNFNWDTGRYPDPDGMIKNLKQRGVKTILWLTGVVNLKGKDTALQKCDTYDFVHVNQLGINNSMPHEWWKGYGIHIDFTKPEAVEWWNTQLDKVFVDGVYGWKVDQGEFWFGDTIQTCIGKMSNKEFRHYYYDAMHEYTVKKKPDGIIIARPYSHQGGCFASTDKLGLGWCGDFSGDWNGLKLQVNNIYQSTLLGYAAPACEVAGFFNKRSSKEEFVRYIQFGCMTAGIINGGENGAFTNHLPWFHGKDVEDIYRFCVVLHDELVPYLFSTIVDAHLHGGTLLNNTSFEDESHQLGKYLFTKAITTPSSNQKSFYLPSEGIWYDFWTGESYCANAEITRKYPLNQFPLFVKKGAIIPMNIQSDITGIGNVSFKDKVTFLIYPNGLSSQRFHLPTGDGIEYFDCSVSYDEIKKELKLNSQHSYNYAFIIRNIENVSSVENADTWEYDEQKKELRIMVSAVDETLYIR